ncbi:glycosyltransferase family 4 protein [Planomicrobium sp. CPCC 101079]|uniref:glycosyltransferase family 4 protein n=1 Tax=Planomicrobium sp. CPCC 101079 TaxID=2599618 RepID=UPI0011B4DB56|nr:glycosyltransferase family 4 protein [Planomicrobium sp. CPCC 101079]TWT03598.1 glycosyltransferase family 4 protein [Planomicrobium sp. CPCC 101079]
MDKKNIDILQIGRDISNTGGGTVILETTNELISQGYNVEILTDSLIDEKYKTKIIPLGNVLLNWEAKNKISKTIRHLLQIVTFMFFGTIIARKYQKEGYVVVNHNIEILGGDLLVFHNVFLAEWLKDKRKIPEKLYRWINPIFTLRIIREIIAVRLKGVKSIIAVSPITLEEVVKISPLKKRKSAINNGVNLKKFHSIDCQSTRKIRESHNFLVEDKLLLFVGHEYERKGLSFLIEALVYLPKNYKLIVVGGRGSSQQKYETLAQNLKVEKRVFFKGTQKEIVEYFQMSDVFILPSAYETWALVGLESLACGTPVLMTNTGGIKEYLIEGYNGYFIEQKSEDIAEKIILILKNEEKYRIMRLNARFSTKDFGWASVAKKYRDEILNFKGENID